MKLCTQTHNFRSTTQRVVDAAIARIDDYEAAGFTPTLRQLFYRLVSDGVLINCKPDYRNFGRHLNEAKEAGIIDWDSVEDRTRRVRGLKRYSSTKEMLEEAVTNWHMDYWYDQPCRPEVWIEKDALLGIIEPVCNEYDVRFYSLRGWGRPADNFSTVQRFLRDFQLDPARPVGVILHLGDFDPTGSAVSGHIEEEAKRYATELANDASFVDVRRIALTKEQINEYNIAPNKIGEDDADKKENESRRPAYLAANNGCGDTWELDALDPAQLQAIVRTAVKSCITDLQAWNKRQRLIKREAKGLRTRVRNLDGAA